jgi:hypothetical protein
MTKQDVEGNFVCQIKVCQMTFLYMGNPKSGSIQQILVPNENVCLTWECRKREFTVLELRKYISEVSGPLQKFHFITDPRYA